MKNNSKAGFSLVELMVVVAIIGILATIAVPNFQKFQARAKQSNAKTELTGIYTAQKAFFVEYNTYHGHLPAVGFVPEGVEVGTNYDTLNTVARIYGSASHSGATPESSPNALGGTLPPLPGGFTGYDGYHSNPIQCTFASTTTGVPSTTGGAAPNVTNTAFQAIAIGCPGGNTNAAAEVDVWTINEGRSLLNIQSGI